MVDLTDFGSTQVFGPLPMADAMHRWVEISMASQSGWGLRVHLQKVVCHTIAYFDGLLAEAQ